MNHYVYDINRINGQEKIEVYQKYQHLFKILEE